MREPAEQDEYPNADKNERPEKMGKVDIQVKYSREEEKTSDQDKDNAGDPVPRAHKADYSYSKEKHRPGDDYMPEIMREEPCIEEQQSKTGQDYDNSQHAFFLVVIVTGFMFVIWFHNIRV